MFKLRPYQEEYIKKCRDGFGSGHRALMLYCPTGGGKTEIAIALMNATFEAGNNTAMIMDRIVLCNQTSDRLDKYKIPHGVLQSGHWRYRPTEKIQICSAQTLEKRGSFPSIKLLIIDEAHVIRKETAEFIQSNPKIRTIGLSASPFTKGLGDVYSKVITATTTRELVDDGWLAPLKVFIAKPIDMVGARKVAGEWSTSEATERGVKITGDIVAEWVKKTHELFGKPRKTIVFCAGVAHGQDLERKFSEAGYNFVSISYKDDDQFKKDVIEDFAKPDTDIHGLIATDILTRGFDCPDVMIGISARPFSKSFASHVQQMGRVMRSCEGKEFAAWLDHSGNYLRFKEQWDELYCSGVDELEDDGEKAVKEPTDKEKEAAKCPMCSALWPKISDTCANCGHIRLRRNDVIDVAGELVELEGGKPEKHTMEEKQRWYSELLGYASKKGYKKGWAYHQFKLKMGVYPANTLTTMAIQPNSEVCNFITHLAIKKSKGRK